MDSALRTYFDHNDRATAIDYVLSLGMSCTARERDHVCRHAIPVTYTCATVGSFPNERPRVHDGSVQIDVIVTTKKFAGAKATLTGKIGPACPPLK